MAVTVTVTVTVAVETPLQDDLRTLIAALNDYLLPLSPPEFQFMLTVEQMADKDTTVFIARDEAGRAVGCAALKLHGDGLGEVKRMFTLPEIRGQRVGVKLLEALQAAARDNGVVRLALETGSREVMASAHRLYERHGFSPCGPFLDYPDSEHNAYYEKALG